MLAGTTLAEGDFVAVDIETSGCRPGTNSIIEIGAVRVSGGKIVASFGELVHSDEPIPPAIRHLTGIDDEMVADAPLISEVMERFREFVGKSVLIAHNHRFDLGFLDFEAERAWGSPFPRPILDTLALSRRLHPEFKKHNLRALATAYDVEAVPDHRATTDAAATAEIWCKMLDELAVRDIRTAGEVARFLGLACQGALAQKLVISTHLPDAPGVYMFKDADGEIVHIGRAKSLRTRVRGYFYASLDCSRPMPAIEAASVDHYVCPSPLDAILLESRLSARYQPHFDRDHERGRRTAYIHVDTESKYPRLRVTRRRYNTGESIGPLSNVWAAETIVDMLKSHYNLRRCHRKLGADTARRPCAFRENGTCPAPCLGKVSARDYGERLAQALAVFDGGIVPFRNSLQMSREIAASEQRYEDAIAHRDALRALDRTMSALDVVNTAAATPGLAIIEGDDSSVVIHLIRYGYLVVSRRLGKSALMGPDWEIALIRAIQSAYTRFSPDPMTDSLSARQVRDVFLIDAYRRQQAPSETWFNGDVDDFARRVVASVRRFMRVPRTRHAKSVDA